MNPGQKMFYDFFMNMVQDGKEEESKKALQESFERQANGTFNAEYMQSIMPKYFSLIKPECKEQLKQAMTSFASKLKQPH